jgi:tetratricopeptide (TPR) repeat protein
MFKSRALFFFLILSGFLLCFTGIQIIAQPPLTEPSQIYIAAQSLFDSGKYSDAIPLYWEVITNHHKHSAKAYFMIGRCYFEQKEYKQARKWYEELITGFPSDLESMQTELKKYWGASFFYEKQFAEALAKFTGKGIPGADGMPPMEQPWYNMVGRCYEQLEDMEKSLEAYNPHLYIHLAPIPKQNAPLIRANYWQIAHQKKDLRNLALYRLGESYLNEGRCEEAIYVLQKIIDTDFYKDAALLIGRCYFEAGEYALAAEWLEKQITQYAHPQPIFYYYLGLSYYYQQHYEAAFKTLVQVQQMFPNVPVECQYRIADSLFALGRYSEAPIPSLCHAL